MYAGKRMSKEEPNPIQILVFLTWKLKTLTTILYLPHTDERTLIPTPTLLTST